MPRTPSPSPAGSLITPVAPSTLAPIGFVSRLGFRPLHTSNLPPIGFVPHAQPLGEATAHEMGFSPNFPSFPHLALFGAPGPLVVTPQGVSWRGRPALVCRRELALFRAAARGLPHSAMRNHVAPHSDSGSTSGIAQSPTAVLRLVSCSGPQGCYLTSIRFS